HERSGGSVAHTRGEMLLNNKPGGPRGEGVLVAAEKSSGACLGNGGGDLWEARFPATHVPYSENKAFAICYGDDAIRRNGSGACNRVTDYGLNVKRCKLRV